MNKIIQFGRSRISNQGPCYVIAEIGHNHQGDMAKALELIKTAARCGADAVKFQKRNNKALYTAEMYQKPYENENSFGDTYGEHREHLEFGWDEYVLLKKCAEENQVEFMCAPFDYDSVDFLERLGITSFKFASGDVTNVPLLRYAAQKNKPIFLSTGACSLEEIEIAYDAIAAHHTQICILHCVCEYPAEYNHLDLRIIPFLKKKFPDAVIGYSSHDNGILAPSAAYLLGATVLEKHFTLNRSWKGTDHKFSLEPEGLRKQVRDLRRIDLMLGDERKKLNDFEKTIRVRMGKSLYASKDLRAGHVLTKEDIVIKSPGGGLEPYHFDKIVGKKLTSDLPAEAKFSWEHLSEAHHQDVSQDKTKITAQRF